MIRPASTREEIIPAITEIVQREVVDQPARIERVIPAGDHLCHPPGGSGPGA